MAVAHGGAEAAPVAWECSASVLEPLRVRGRGGDHRQHGGDGQGRKQCACHGKSPLWKLPPQWRRHAGMSEPIDTVLVAVGRSKVQVVAA
jgi:hypothetical protein